jgi:hypothetical protein
LSKKFIKNLKQKNQENHLIKENETKKLSSQQVVKKSNGNDQIKKSNNLYKWLFGTILLTFSTSALFFIFKIKDKFRVQKK